MINYRIIVSNLDTGREITQENIREKGLKYHLGMLVKSVMPGARLAKLQVIIEDMANEE